MRFSLALMVVLDIAGGLVESSQFSIKLNSSVCLKEGMQNIATCTLRLKTSSGNITGTVKDFSLIWYQNGLQMRNATKTNLTNDQIVSLYRVRNAGLLTCCVANASLPNCVANPSLSIEMQPRPVTGLLGTPRFTSDKESFRYVSVSWVREGRNYVYTLFYKIYLNICVFPCPEGSITPACDDKTCTALIHTEGFDMSQLVFHVSTRHGKCKTRSRVWKYNLTLTACGYLPPKSLFYFPHPPTNLEIKTSYRRVTLKWKDIIYWLSNVFLTYSCSKTSDKQTALFKELDTREIILTGKDIRDYAPYELCTFCLSIKEYQCGQFSEPLCNTTNLSEEQPSEAPNITCTYDTCPSSYDADGKYRNLTLTWELPAETYWGGILREVKLRYWSTFANASNTTSNEIVVKNMSKRSVLLHLDKETDYTADLQVCNRGGCSGYSQQLQIHSTQSSENARKTGNSYLIPGYIAGAAAVLILIVVTSIFVLRRKAPSSQLEDLSEPDSPDYNIPNEDGTYDTLLKLDGDNHETLDTIKSG